MTYPVEFKCNNCFFVFTKIFKKAIVATCNEECPTCGVKDSSKTGRWLKPV